MVDILNAPLGEKTTPVSTDTVPLGDDYYAQLANIHKALTQATATQAGTVELATDAETITGTSTTLALTPANLKAWLPGYFLLFLPDGTMVNGKISPTVSANDLVLAILTADGSTPSATNPVWVKINGTLRTITAATSCTLADATNWMNLGSAELATIEQDLFAYAIWDSNSSVVAVSPSRIPYRRLVSNFSATTTNENHLGNYANFTATDDVCVIGRFAATLSAGAGYTWTVPTYTNANLIQHPIFETRWLSWSPSWTNLAVGDGTQTAKYRLMQTDMALKYELTWGSTTAISGAVSSTLPFTVVTNSSVGTPLGQCTMVDTGTGSFYGALETSSGAGTALRIRVYTASGTYLSPTALSSTVPHTWAATDELNYTVPRIPIV